MTHGMVNQLYYHSVIIRNPLGTPDEEFSSSYIHTWIRNYFDSDPNVSDFIFQLERGAKEGKLHYQMYVHLSSKKRSRTLQKDWELEFPGIGVNFSSTAGITALKEYCMKKDTRVLGPWGKRSIYLGQDLGCMVKPFPWQQKVLDIIASEPNDRTIHYLHEPDGSVGKSKLVKYLGYHKLAVRIPLGTATQIKTFVTGRGPARCYLIDLPRSRGKQEHLEDLYSAIEGIKNGYVISGMYGKTHELFMEPPHVFVFSNQPPNKKLLSADKWCVTKLF